MRSAITTAVIAAALAVPAFAGAASYLGESLDGDVNVRVQTNADGIPTKVGFSRYTVRCENGERLGIRVGGFIAPFDRVTRNRIVDKEKGRRGDVFFAAVLKAHRSDGVWRGRFHSRWVLDVGDPDETSCRYAFRFRARLLGEL